jgi:hypothetical protein
VPYVLDEFHYFFETPYDTTDPNFPEYACPLVFLVQPKANSALDRCSIDRPPGASAAGRMMLVNHDLDLMIGSISIPDNGADSTTNSPASIEAQSSICSGLYGRNPNVILVDYFNVGKYIGGGKVAADIITIIVANSFPQATFSQRKIN